MKYTMIFSIKAAFLTICLIFTSINGVYCQLGPFSCTIPPLIPGNITADCRLHKQDPMGVRYFLPVAYAGQPYCATIRLSNAAAAGSWSFVGGTLPAGLAAASIGGMSSTLQISFTPPAIGFTTGQFTIDHTGLIPASQTIEVFIPVLAPAANSTTFTLSGLTPTPATLNGTVGSPIGAAGEAIFRATSGSGLNYRGEVTWSVAGASAIPLPAGLELVSRSSLVAAADVLTTYELWVIGTPTSAASGVLTLEGRNCNNTVVQTVGINLNIVSPLSLIWDASNPTSLPNRTRLGDPTLDPYPVQTFSVTASDAVTTGYTWSLSQVSGPTTLANNTHYIFDIPGIATGTPTGNQAEFQLVTTSTNAVTAGTYVFNIVATRSGATAQSGAFTVVVHPALTISIGGFANPLRTLTVGDAFTPPGGFTMLAGGGDPVSANNNFTWNFVNPDPDIIEIIPPWLAISGAMANPQIGQLQQTFLPTQGEFIFRVQVTNSTGGRVLSNSTIAADLFRIVVNRKPIDMVIVLDRSGSMTDRACSGCSSGLWTGTPDCAPVTGINRDSRWCRLIANLDALLMFLNDDFSAGGNITTADRIGVVYFDHEIQRYRNINLLNFDGSVFTGSNSISTQTNNRLPRGGTCIGGALQSAINMLDLSTASSRCKYIILMTDGEENTSPIINLVGSNYIIQNDPTDLYPGTGIINVPLNVPLTLNTLDLEIHTIGLASQADLEELLGIANATGGVSNIVDDMAGIHIANTTMDEALYNQMVGVLSACSPQFVAVRHRQLNGTQGDETFCINKNVKKISFKLVGEASNNLNFQLLKNGQPISGIGERTATASYHKFYFVDFPTTDQNGNAVTPEGNWTMRISGSNGAPFVASVIVEEKIFDQDYALVPTNNFYRAGDPLKLSANLSYAGVPITNATVTAEILAPGESLPTKISQKPPVSKLKKLLTDRFAYTQTAISTAYVAESDLRFTGINLVATGRGPMTVRGRVLDGRGEPLIGATITVKGKASGAATDIKGEFSIRAEPNDILVTAYTGLSTVETAINGLDFVEIRMGGDPKLKTVSGLVRDIITDRPLGGVLVQAKGAPRYSTRTKDDGSYIFTVPNNELLVFSGAGIQTVETSFDAQSKRNILLGPPGFMPPIVLDGVRYEANTSIAAIQRNQLWVTGLLNEYVIPVSNKIILTHRGNGHYEAPFSKTDITGDYKIVFTTSVNHPEAGCINRMKMQDAVVRFGPLNIATTQFEAVYLGQVLEYNGNLGPYYQYDLTIKPKDKLGNLMGIGKMNTINISSTTPGVIFTGLKGIQQRSAALPSDSIFIEEPIDQLNGSYKVRISLKNRDINPQIKVVIDQQESTPLFNGKLSQIPKQGNNGSMLPLGTGIAMPMGAFGNGFNPGWMIELKFGKPISPNLDRLYYNAEIGYYTFKAETSGKSMNITGAGLGLRYDLARFGMNNKWKFSIDGNGAYYKPSDRNGNFGINAGLGLTYDIVTKISLGLDGSYYHVFTDPGIDFLGLGLALRLNLNN